MKIRRAYLSKGLKTKTVKLTLLGGDKDYCQYADGYYMCGDKLSPSVMFQLYNPNAKMYDICSVKYYSHIKAAVVLAATGHVYRWTYASADNPFSYSGLAGTVKQFATACYYKDVPVVAVVSGARIVIVRTSTYEIHGVPYQLRGAAYLYGRLFSVDITNNCVRWSGSDIMDWTESYEGAGHICLDPARGELFNVVTFGDKLVVFREYGLDVLKVFGDPKHFSVEQFGSRLLTDKLVLGTCVECGNKLYFASSEHIYTFDGDRIEEVILPDYMKGLWYTNGDSIANRYVHFYCRPKNHDDYCQFELDVQTGKCAFFAPNMKHIWHTGEQYFGFKDNCIYRQNAFGYDVPYIWRTVPVDAGTPAVKTLKSIYTDCTDIAKVRITADGVTREVSGSGTIPVGLSGRRFVFEIRDRGTAGVLEAEWEVRV